MDLKSKFSNYGLWISLFSLIGLILTDLGRMPQHYTQYTDIILGILTAAGIVSNPTSGKWYKDQHQEEVQEQDAIEADKEQ